MGMTKSKHNYFKQTLTLIFCIFCLAFVKSSFFDIKEVEIQNLNPSLEKEVKHFVNKLKGKNLVFLKFNQIKEYLKEYPNLELKNYNKILPNKIILKLNTVEELGTYYCKKGFFDLYEEGFLFSRYKKEDEKFIIEGDLSKDELRELSKILKENNFLYENFIALKLDEEKNWKLFSKDGVCIKFFDLNDVKNLKNLKDILIKCPELYSKKELTFFNKNLFLVTN